MITFAVSYRCWYALSYVWSHFDEVSSIISSNTSAGTVEYFPKYLIMPKKDYSSFS